MSSADIKPARLVPTGFGVSKEEKEGVFVDYATRAEAAQGLSSEPPGSIKLCLDKDKKGELFLSYKFNKFIFHRPLRKIELTIKKTEEEIIAKTDIKGYRFVRSNLFQFAVKLHRFIWSIIKNKNWVEKELTPDQQDQEIALREFVIFPNRDAITILQKNTLYDNREKSTVKSTTVLIDVNRCMFVSDTNLASNVDDFNIILLREFLKIDTTKSFLVAQMLGYDSNDLDADITKFPHQPLGRRRMIVSVLSVIDLKQKVYYLSVIGLSLAVINPYTMDDYPPQVLSTLELIGHNVNSAHDSSLEWVKKGIFRTIFQIFSLCGKADFPSRYDLAVEICSVLLTQHQLACREFYRSFWEAMSQQADDPPGCVGLCQGLTKLIHIPSLADVFMNEAGIPRLIQLYKQFRQNQKGRLHISSSFFPYKDKSSALLGWDTSTPSISRTPSLIVTEAPTHPTSPEDSEKHTCSVSEIDESSQSRSETTKSTSSFSPRGHHAEPVSDHVPPIMIPNTSIVKKDIKSKKGPEETMIDLAKKLGEGYISAELTILLSFKDAHDRKKKDPMEPLNVKDPSQMVTDEKKDETTDAQLPNSIRHNVFDIISVILATGTPVVRIPVNLVFSELLDTYRDIIHDKQLRSTLLKILERLADTVELFHKDKWLKLTKGMAPNIKENYRKKSDLLIFRIHSRLDSALHQEDLDEITVQLTILGDYLECCRTRVMSSQVVDVCLDTLLRIKGWLITTPPISIHNMEYTDLTHSLLRVFDHLAVHNVLGPLNDLLLTVLVFKDTTFQWFRAYAECVLTNQQFNKIMINKYGEQHNTDMRVAVLRHYKACVKMVNNEFSSDEGTTAAIATKIALIKKMDFLTYPDAILQQILNESDNQQKNFAVQNEALDLIHKILCIKEKELPLLDDATYVDSYIRFHYIHFLRLYHNYSIDPRTLTLCRKHLRVLTDYTKQKNERITRKFYQLKVMDFMVHMINLEYNVQILAKNAWQDMQKNNQQPKQGQPQKEEPKQILPSKETKPETATKATPITKTPTKADSSESDDSPRRKPLLPSLSFKTKPVVAPKGKPSSSSSSDSTSEDEKKKKKPGLPSLSGFALKSGGVKVAPAPAASSSSSTSESDDSPKKKKPAFSLAGFKTKTGDVKVAEEPKKKSSSSEESDSSTSEETPKKKPLLPTLSGFKTKTGDVKVADAKKSSSSEESTTSSEETPKKKPAFSLAGFKTKTGDIKVAEEKKPSSSSSESESSSVEETPKKKPAFSLAGFKTKTGDIKVAEEKNQKQKSSSSDESTSSEEASTPKKPVGKPTFSLAGFKTKTGDIKVAEEKKPSSSSEESESESSSAEEPPKKKPLGKPAFSLAGFKTKTGDIKVAEQPKQPSSSSSTDESSSVEETPKKKPAFSLAGFKTKTGDIKVAEQPKQPSSSSSTDASSSVEETPKKKPTFALAGFKTKTGDIKVAEEPPKSSSSESTDASSSSEEAPKKKPAFSLAGFKTKTGDIKTVTEETKPSEPSASSTDSSSETSEEVPKKKPLLPSLSGFTTKTGDVKVQQRKSSSSEESTDSSSSEEPPKKKPMLPSLGGYKTKTGDIKTVEPTNDTKKASSSSSESTDASSSSEEPPKKKPMLPSLGGYKTKTGDIKTVAETKPAPVAETKPLKESKAASDSVKSMKSNTTMHRSAKTLPNFSSKDIDQSPVKDAPPTTKRGSSSVSKSQSGPKRHKHTPGREASTLKDSQKISKDQLTKLGSPASIAKNQDPTVAISQATKGSTVNGQAQAQTTTPAKDSSSNATSSINEPAKTTNPTPPTGGEDQPPEQPKKPDHVVFAEALYLRERYKRKLYTDKKLHVQGLEFITMLLLTPNGFALEPLYCHSQPMLTLKINILFYVRLHINHPCNLPILGPLQDKLRANSESAFLFLKMMSKRFFQPQMIHKVKDLGKGAFGAVYLCTFLGQNVAVKQMNTEKDINDRCIPHDIFSEILILDKWKEDERICKLIDYGASDDSYWIVMKCYAGGSLRSWREKQVGKPLQSQLLLYLNIFEDCLNISRFFSENHVNHYDIKCDNYLLDLAPGVSPEDFLNQPSHIPNFRVCLADFGTCLVYTDPKDEFTVDARGTQPIQSPEMVTINQAKKVEDRNYDRLKHHGAGQASDMWSLGCLLYEILTCEFLFDDPGFLAFLFRVTTPKAELIPLKYRQLVDEDPDILQYLSFLLVRDQHRRPLVPEAISRFQRMKAKIETKIAAEKEAQGQLADSSPGLTTTPSTPPVDSPKGLSPSTSSSNLPHIPQTVTTGATTPALPSTASPLVPPTSVSPTQSAPSSPPEPSGTGPGLLSNSDGGAPTDDHDWSDKSGHAPSLNLKPRMALTVNPTTVRKTRDPRRLSITNKPKKSERTPSHEEKSPRRNSLSLSDHPHDEQDHAGSREDSADSIHQHKALQAEIRQRYEEKQRHDAQSEKRRSEKLEPEKLAPPSAVFDPHPSPRDEFKKSKNKLLSSKFSFNNRDSSEINIDRRSTMDDKPAQYRYSSEYERSVIEAHRKHQHGIAEAEAAKRAKALEAITENNIVYEAEELAYFDCTPTEILPYLWLVGGTPISKNNLKFKYGITHIVNCTKNTNLFTEHFNFQSFDIDIKAPASLRNPLHSFTKFINEAHNQGERNRVLVISENGTGSSLVIGFLMDLRKLTFFEAFQEVYSRRYTLKIEAGLLQQLLSFELEKQNKDKKKYFHCLCKRNSWISLIPFKEKPKRCSCQYSDMSFCPNTGCGVFCEEMLKQTKWKWKEKVVRWGYTSRDHVQFQFDNVEEYKPLYNLSPSQTKNFKTKAWTVYRCRTCLSLTHAVANNNDLKWAIVTNTE